MAPCFSLELPVSADLGLSGRIPLQDLDRALLQEVHIQGWLPYSVPGSICSVSGSHGQYPKGPSTRL